MKNLSSKWKNHLLENNMTYYGHLKFAIFYGFVCCVAGLSLFFHALFPCWLQDTGSDLVRILSKVFRKNK
jgi:hypothetical protein